MTISTSIATDLITPLGAYLRLREAGRASFLLESVERGRLGRFSFVGCGSQLVDFDEAEASNRAVVGYLGYDHVAKLEPTVPLPATGPDQPESRFVIADVLVRFDHARGLAEVLVGDPGEAAKLLERHVEPPPPGSAGAGTTQRSSRSDYERSVEVAKEHIRDGDAFQIVLSQRAERRTGGDAARRLPLAAARQPVAVSLPAGARRDRARRLLARDARQGGRDRAPASTRSPARPSPARETPNGCSPPRRTGRARDARRPRPQRPLARLQGRARSRSSASSSRSGSRTSRTSSRRSPASCSDGVSPFDLLRACFPAGTVSGAPKVRAMQIISELEGYRRGRVRRRRRLCASRASSFDTCIAIRTSCSQEGVAYLQAGAGHRRRLRSPGRARGVPEQARGARDGDRARRGTMRFC